MYRDLIVQVAALWLLAAPVAASLIIPIPSSADGTLPPRVPPRPPHPQTAEPKVHTDPKP